MSPKTTTFTPYKLELFKQAYRKAAMNGKETFLFEEHPYLVTYAYYLIEYLERRFGIPAE